MSFCVVWNHLFSAARNKKFLHLSNWNFQNLYECKADWNLKSYMSARQALHTKENKNDNCIFITQSIIYIDFFVHQIEMMFFFHYFCSKCKINDFYKEMREHFYSQDVYCGVLNGLLRSHKTHRLLLPQRKKTIM